MHSMMSLSARRLQVFVSIVETGSFAGAARWLGIAQPSVSAHVKSLEKETGAQLFERASGRHAVLTQAGRSFLAHARELIDRTAKLQEDLIAQTGKAASTVAFSCQRSLAHTALRMPLATFAREHRDIRLSVSIAFQEEVIAAVRMGFADIGCLMSNDEPDGLPSLVIGRLPFAIFAAPDHPLAGRKGVAPHELSDYDFVGPAASSLFGRTQKKMLTALGVERIRVVAEATEFSVVRDLGEAGIGLGCSLRASIEPDVAAGRIALIDLDAPSLALDVRLLVNPKRKFARPVQDFANHLKTAIPKG